MKPSNLSSYVPFLPTYLMFTFCRLLRRGMWKDGIDGETPAAYKRRHTENAVQNNAKKNN